MFRARSMTEQQEQGEEPGLVSTQDLDPSKDDDGHFRQISHAHTRTRAHAPSASCAQSWVPAPGDSFFLHLFGAFI